MEKENAFVKRIKALYASIMRAEQSAPGKKKISEEAIREAELKAMADVFLGEDYDAKKLRAVSALQGQLHRTQERLAEEFSAGRLSAKDYAHSVNKALEDTFAKCEGILV